ncbi:MAG: nicotinate-nucleotide adenylyltransferase [bacterium]|nr:nicotinate-nucleotide adenylyltransferase [bacterium]
MNKLEYPVNGESYVGPQAPIVRARMRVGLLGGSFDPPHKGHVHISLEAIKRLQLDQLWWLVSPGNPLKEQGPWPLERRLQQCGELARHPKIKITALEASLGSPYTAKTLTFLTRRYPATRFVWLMGADNMASVHLWQDWQRIFRAVPVAVLDRPGQRHQVSLSIAAHVFGKDRIAEKQAASILNVVKPAWTILSVPLNYESSTRIREKHRS